MQALVRNYEPLMQLLREAKEDDDPIAEDLFNQLSCYRIVAVLLLMLDLLNQTCNLCKIFQFRDVSFTALGSAVSVK
jgi:hypothetical protein